MCKKVRCTCKVVVLPTKPIVRRKVHDREEGEMARKCTEEGENEMLGVGRYRWEYNLMAFL